ncbi:MAG TPA: SUMF1/EgtB/PvdO family nonheme iron enzyme [Thermoanaerobaculia bacterium]|jgi:formylglycine-generating enzyme required for sulfatase activity
MRHSAFPGEVGREQLLSWYRAARARTRALFDLVAPEAYYDRPIALRNPIVFYEGHLPGFSVNTLVKLALKRKGVDDRLETIFARGIDPEDEASVPAAEAWPSRDEVQSFAAACDALVEDALQHAELENEAIPHLRNGEAAFTVMEHELMHQETLSYLLHQLPYEKKRHVLLESRALSPAPRRANSPSLQGEAVSIPAGTAILGAPRGTFGWDNEFPQHRVHVPPFTIDALNVTNGDWLEYMDATGAKAPHFWARGEDDWCFRGMFQLQRLNLHAPVYVTHEEAAAYARWKGKRLPTEAEFDRAAYGDGDSDDPPAGNYDFASFEPVSVGQYPPSASGVYDLVGNGWEWTSTVFAGFAGFEPMPSYALYSTDFFDGAHYVLKGASPVTPRELVRRSFRNWFRPNYPYVYATFRCAQ